MLDVSKFLHDGWVIVDLPNRITDSILSDIENKISCGTSAIHNYYDDESVKKLHVSLSKYFWKQEYSLAIADAMLPIIQQLIGLDVMVQYNPYLRIARPNKPQDNIGYHKATQYGQSPYELAVHIPFVNLDEKSAICVISGSHLLSEDVFTTVTPDGYTVKKGSIVVFL